MSCAIRTQKIILYDEYEADNAGPCQKNQSFHHRSQKFMDFFVLRVFFLSYYYVNKIIYSFHMNSL